MQQPEDASEMVPESALRPSLTGLIPASGQSKYHALALMLRHLPTFAIAQSPEQSRLEFKYTKISVNSTLTLYRQSSGTVDTNAAWRDSLRIETSRATTFHRRAGTIARCSIADISQRVVLTDRIIKDVKTVQVCNCCHCVVIVKHQH